MTISVAKFREAIHRRDMHLATNQSPSEPETEDWGGHPLFPRAETETDPDPRKFDRIQLIRYRADGSREVAPKIWKGSELHSWQQIIDEYGGESTYQLVSQCGKTHKYSAWSEKWYFGSPAQKPFANGPAGAAVARQETAIQEAPQMPLNDALLQMNLALLKMFMEKQIAPQPNPIEMLQACVTLLNNANCAPNPYELFKEMMPLMNNGERNSRTFMQGIEFARELFNHAPAEADPAPSNSDDISDMMNIVKLFTEVRSANPAPAPPPPAQLMQNVFAPPCPPPPGYGWLYTQQGWVAVPIAMTTQSAFANCATTAPIPQAPMQAPVSAAPSMQINDEDTLLRKLVEHPETRAKIHAMLAPPAIAPIPAPIAPPVPAAVPSVPQVAPVQTTPEAPQMPSGLSQTPSSQTPVPMQFTKPVEKPIPPPVATICPAQPLPDAAFPAPDDVPIDDELRAMLAEPEFQRLALAIVGPESKDALTRLVQKNRSQLRDTGLA